MSGSQIFRIYTRLKNHDSFKLSFKCREIGFVAKGEAVVKLQYSFTENSGTFIADVEVCKVLTQAENYIFMFSEDMALKLGHSTNFEVLFPTVSMNFLYQPYIKIYNYRDEGLFSGFCVSIRFLKFSDVLSRCHKGYKGL